jgi:DNA modification methylase
VQDFALTEPGDLWMVGNHRLLCGDSILINQIERFMDGHKADLVFTDPPYNVSYEGYTKQKLTIQGDEMTAKQFQEFSRVRVLVLSMGAKARRFNVCLSSVLLVPGVP